MVADLDHAEIPVTTLAEAVGSQRVVRGGVGPVQGDETSLFERSTLLYRVSIQQLRLQLLLGRRPALILPAPASQRLSHVFG